MSDSESTTRPPEGVPPGANCAECPAAVNGKPANLIPTYHPKRAPRLVVIGDWPGRSDIVKGETFTPASVRAQVLRGMMGEAGIDWLGVMRTNACLCPCKGDKEGQVAAMCCAGRLAEELKAIPPEVPLVPLGTIPERILTGHGNIMKGRGFLWRVPPWVKSSRPKPWRGRILWDAKKAIRQALADRVVFPTFHPAFIRQAGTWEGVMLGDFRRIARWMRKPFPLEDEGPFEVCDTPGKLEAALGQGFGREVVVDVETGGKDAMVTPLLMVGFCDVASMRVVQAFPWGEGMAEVVKPFLAPRVAVLHNGTAFDEVVLEVNGVTYPQKEDTLVAHHAIASHLRQSLDFCASRYTDAAPWKLRYKGQTADDKGGFGVSAEDLPVYNCADVRLDALVWRRMQGDLARERTVYDFDMAMAGIYRRMRMTGIRVDLARRAELIAKLAERAEGSHTQLKALTRRAEFNPSQAAAIREALYGEGGVEVTHVTPTGQPATNRAVLEALRKQDTYAGRLADLVIRWRHAKDVRAEYLENLPIGQDGRVHAAWKACGVETGRPACREPNLLNTPRMGKDPEEQVRAIYIPAEGHVFVYYDLSQAEARFAAYISGDAEFMRACEGDVHVGNACTLWPEKAAMIRADPKGRGKPYRDIAKNVGFAIAYLAEADTVFAYLRSRGFPVKYREVEAMLGRLRYTYRGYYDYVEENCQRVARDGYMRSVFLGRIRWMGQKAAKPMVANFPIQSGVADVMGRAILELDGVLSPLGARLVVYAYDSCTYECPAGVADKVRAIIAEYWGMAIDIPGSGRKLTQPIDLKVGMRWSEFG